MASPKHPLLKGGFKSEESKKENTVLSWNKVIVSIPHLQGCWEPSQGPPVPLGSLELPTEQTVIRKWGDQQQAQGCVCTEHRLPRRALHTDLFALCFFMGCAGGSSTNTSAGPLFEFRGSFCLREAWLKVRTSNTRLRWIQGLLGPTLHLQSGKDGQNKFFHLKHLSMTVDLKVVLV